MWTSRIHLPTVRYVGRVSLSTFRHHQNPRGSPRPLRRQHEGGGKTKRQNALPSSSSSSSSSQQPNTSPQGQSPEYAGSAANPNYDPSRNTLLAPVHIPKDPAATLHDSHPATSILANSGLVVQRQLEMMNVMMLVVFYVLLI